MMHGQTKIKSYLSIEEEGSSGYRVTVQWVKVGVWLY